MTDQMVSFEIVVIGGGPAGLAAACAAAESGRQVALVDETPWLGGQIWRGQSPTPTLPEARQWFDRFRRSSATLFGGTSVFSAPEPGLLLAERENQPCQIRWQRLILATGARNRILSVAGAESVLYLRTRGDAEISHLKKIVYSPTFVMLAYGEEVGRIVGYQGSDLFWMQLEQLAAKAGFVPVGKVAH